MFRGLAFYSCLPCSSNFNHSTKLNPSDGKNTGQNKYKTINFLQSGVRNNFFQEGVTCVICLSLSKHESDEHDFILRVVSAEHYEDVGDTSWLKGSFTVERLECRLLAYKQFCIDWPETRTPNILSSSCRVVFVGSNDIGLTLTEMEPLHNFYFVLRVIPNVIATSLFAKSAYSISFHSRTRQSLTDAD